MMILNAKFATFPKKAYRKEQNMHELLIATLKGRC